MFLAGGNRMFKVKTIMLAAACALAVAGCGSTSQAQASFTCSVDRPGIGGWLTTTNPGTSAINVATVQVSFYDAAGRVLDTGTTDVGQQVGPGSLLSPMTPRRYQPRPRPAGRRAVAQDKRNRRSMIVA
jgi:hypothetical protein